MEPIVQTTEVPCGQEMAFTTFLDMGSWWPTDRFATSVMRGAAVAEVRVDARQDGEIVEVGTDGVEQSWGRITAFEPFGLLRMDFHVPHPSEEHPGTTTVEVRFTEAGADRTLVELTQTGWDGLGASAEQARGGYTHAWTVILDEAYAAACGATPGPAS